MDTARPTEPAAVMASGRLRRGRAIVAVLLAVAGLAALGIGSVTVQQELARRPTAAEIEAAGTRELGLRWRMLTAGEVFPVRLSFVDVKDFSTRDTGRFRRSAARVGIAPAASCASALDAKAAQMLTKHGCRTVLRATYIDDTGTRVTTLGIAVLPSADDAAGADADYTAEFGVEGKNTHGLRAVGFPGTLTAGFVDANRQELWLESKAGPYVLFRASGWIDSRPHVPRTQRQERFEFARGALDALEAGLAELDIPCGSQRIEC